MPFLGLVGVPLSYPEFQALRNAATTGGRLANAAATAAEGSILGSGAILLGGFLAGYAVGEAILKGLENPNLLPPMTEGLEGGNNAFQYVLTIQTNDTLFGKQVFEKTITGAFGAIFFKYSQPESGTYFIITSRGLVSIININVENVLQAPVVLSARRLDGTPEAFRKMPTFPETKPVQPPVKVPAVIPIPSFPAPFPITPTVYPSPEFDPDQPDKKLFPPGITVEIPETGDQYRFTPQGVSIARSNPTSPNPLTTPQKVALPPGTPPSAEAPCPCPEEESGSKEILCRIKTLQSEVLDDGYTFTTSIVPEGVGGSVTGVQKELVQANVFLSTFPLNVSRQYYEAFDSDVIYAGWFSWTKEGRAGERIPLAFENNSFYPPPEADGFKYAFNRGCTGSGSYVTRVKKNYVDNC